ncbi:MAG: fumarylacetoacetate hydrolase family protein, partial [Deltaproteobacteria bacterium]|nr:fumarylacetoacetate hydrolase family protein [Deltaproteobacteria bacterium]
MALNVVRFRHEDTVRWGVAREGVVRPVPGVFETTGDFLRGVSLADLAGLAGPDLPESSLEILSPVTRNQQFICQGANYRSHMLESGIDPDEKGFNMIFRKASSCIVPATSDVVRPSRVRLLDYEIELGLVLGADVTGPRELSDRDLASVVAGIVIVNDYSARDVQIPETQFYK